MPASLRSRSFVIMALLPALLIFIIFAIVPIFGQLTTVSLSGRDSVLLSLSGWIIIE